jgi:hypothetical protein
LLPPGTHPTAGTQGGRVQVVSLAKIEVHSSTDAPQHRIVGKIQSSRNVGFSNIVAHVGTASGHRMQSRADEYREHCRVCERQAQETDDPEAKEGFARLARLWAELADKTERD